MKNKNGLGLSAADFLWSGCVVAPLVVTYWRGTWDLLEDWVSTRISNKTMYYRLLLTEEICSKGIVKERFIKL